MKPSRMIMVTALALTVGACASVETTSRNQPLGAATSAKADAAANPQAQPYRISSIDITVPRTLRVSEANVYYPSADIVWRGDLLGDRYNQVGAIFDKSAKRAAAGLKQGPAVKMEITVHRFHSLTERARYTVGGMHSLKFTMTLRNPKTGAVIESREIDASFKALGGSRAIEAELRGDTQKVRVTDHLARTIYRQLAGPAVRTAG